MKSRDKIVLIFLGAAVLIFLFFERAGLNPAFKPAALVFLKDKPAAEFSSDEEDIFEAVLPEKGYAVEASYGNLGPKLLEAGVIDLEKFKAVYERSSRPLTEEQFKILTNGSKEKIVINEENSHFLLNFFWALGLANKNWILEGGPMVKYGQEGINNFASTGGWILGKSEAMDYYSRYELIVLTDEKQALVERVSKNIYRPCCNNPTYFPDCNHGMAMLGLLELLAERGFNEKEMYETALRFNSFWFPETYLTLAEYFKLKGKSWSEISPETILGFSYSSASGYGRILQEIEPVSLPSAGCWV